MNFPNITIGHSMLNVYAILACVVANMLLGSVWYSKLMFGKMWIKAVGKTEEEIKKSGAGKAYMMMTVGSLVSALILSHLIVNIAAIDTVNHTLKAISGMKIATYCWLGFFLPLGIGEAAFEGKSKTLLFINGFFHLVEYNLMAVIIVYLT